eukprot:364912-Chlamydomonas_euryale.AAC.16
MPEPLAARIHGCMLKCMAAHATACMNAWLHARRYARTHGCTHGSMRERMAARMNAWLHARLHT